MKRYLFPIILAVLLLLAAILGVLQNDRRFLGSNSSSLSSDRSMEEYLATAQNLAQQNNLPVEVSFLATGDIMLSRSVANAIKKANDPLLPFRNVSGLLAQADFNFGNLESPMTNSPYFGPSGQMVFNVPPGYAEGLVKNNFKILNLANNHAMDQGKNGIDYTNKFLTDNFIKHIGTGSTLEEAWRPAIVEVKGVRIGFVGASYASANDGGVGKNNYVARIEDTEKLQAAVSYLRTNADFVVVSMHAGEEYKREPNADQKSFARTAIDAGADMVIGGHPHWIQTIEKYKDKYICYSLGNFIFDQEWSRETKEGLTLMVSLSGTPKNPINPNLASIDDLQGTKTAVSLKQIELIPVIIENYSQPRVANEQEAADILKKIGLSSKFIVQ